MEPRVPLTWLAPGIDAYATDRKAPFGGVVVVNRTIDRDLALNISEIWLEIIIAPQIHRWSARDIWEEKKSATPYFEGWGCF